MSIVEKLRFQLGLYGCIFDVIKVKGQLLIKTITLWCK